MFLTLLVGLTIFLVTSLVPGKGFAFYSLVAVSAACLAFVCDLNRVSMPLLRFVVRLLLGLMLAALLVWKH